MRSKAKVTLKDGTLEANLDASELFKEAVNEGDYFKKKLDSQYADILNMVSDHFICCIMSTFRYPDLQRLNSTHGMQVSPVLEASACIPSILKTPGPQLRMVWHFAGSCAAPNVVNVKDMGVIGTTNLHIADTSTSKEAPDGGAMAYAYLTGHLTAAQMFK